MKPRLLIADAKGKIYDSPVMVATGMKAGIILPLHPSELIKLPRGSRLFQMPARRPVGLDPEQCIFAPSGSRYRAVSAFLPPGYTATYSAAYVPAGRPKALPLYAYAACASYKGGIYAAAVRVDTDPRHDSTRIPLPRVRRGIKEMRKRFPRNRLVRHLEACALSYGCCGAQNFFLGRHECPLPSSPACNSACAGCISRQEEDAIPATQPRIGFTPTPIELAEIAIHHIRTVPDTVVSFGQGCDGEPLLQDTVIEEAIRIIRIHTPRGVINMNTNASRPDVVRRLAEAGLDSIRVSMNSARAEYYERYYRPADYTFEDVLRSIRLMKKSGGFVSLNYLTMPGFTDTVDEYMALRRLARLYRIDMIQWRNLNFDPLLYFSRMRTGKRERFMGLRHEMDLLRAEFPKLMQGYFNPTRGRMRLGQEAGGRDRKEGADKARRRSA